MHFWAKVVGDRLRLGTDSDAEAYVGTDSDAAMNQLGTDSNAFWGQRLLGTDSDEGIAGREWGQGQLKNLAGKNICAFVDTNTSNKDT